MHILKFPLHHEKPFLSRNCLGWGFSFVRNIVANICLVPFLICPMQAYASPPIQPTGPQKALVIGFSFPEDPPTDSPLVMQGQLSKLNDLFFGATNSVAAYWKEASYGGVTLMGDTVGWYTVSTRRDQISHCSETNIISELLQAASSRVDLTQYSRVFLVNRWQPSKIICGGWAAGLATGSTYSTPQGNINVTVSDGDMRVFLFNNETQADLDRFNINLVVGGAAHEGGHQLGLWHANSILFGDATIGGLGGVDQGQLITYGDFFDSMGPPNAVHYSGQKKYFLGWLTDNDIHHVAVDGTYRIQPLSSALTGMKAARVFRGVDTIHYDKSRIDSLHKEFYWVETRQPVGFDSDLPVFGAANVYYENYRTLPTAGGLLESGWGTLLLDMHPQSQSTSSMESIDAGLQIGEQFTDPVTGITLAHQGLDGGDLLLGVSYPPNRVDLDQDGIPDIQENLIGTSPTAEDTDGDGLSDLWELCFGGGCESYNPNRDTNPLQVDSDGDGVPDGREIIFGGQPLYAGNPPSICSFVDGFSATIVGKNLEGLLNIKINGNKPLGFNVDNSNTITVVGGPFAPVSTIEVSTLFGATIWPAQMAADCTSTATGFYYTGTSIGSPGDLIVIFGTNLENASNLRFNGFPASILAAIPAGTAVVGVVPNYLTEGPILIDTPFVKGLPVGTYTPPVPTIEYWDSPVSPALVKIHGTGFVQGLTTVQVDGNPINAEIRSPGEIEIYYPAGASAVEVVAVTTPQGTVMLRATPSIVSVVQHPSFASAVLATVEGLGFGLTGGGVRVNGLTPVFYDNGDGTLTVFAKFSDINALTVNTNRGFDCWGAGC